MCNSGFKLFLTVSNCFKLFKAQSGASPTWLCTKWTFWNWKKMLEHLRDCSEGGCDDVLFSSGCYPNHMLKISTDMWFPLHWETTAVFFHVKATPVCQGFNRASWNCPLFSLSLSLSLSLWICLFILVEIIISKWQRWMMMWYVHSWCYRQSFVCPTELFKPDIFITLLFSCPVYFSFSLVPSFFQLLNDQENDEFRRGRTCGVCALNSSSSVAKWCRFQELGFSCFMFDSFQCSCSRRVFLLLLFTDERK